MKTFNDQINFWASLLDDPNSADGLLSEASRAVRTFEEEQIDLSQLTIIDKPDEELEGYELKSKWLDCDHGRISVRTAKKSKTTSGGTAFIWIRSSSGSRCYRGDISLNQLVTLILHKSNAQFFDSDLCFNLFGNKSSRRTASLQESSAAAFTPSSLDNDLREFFKMMPTISDDPTWWKAIEKKHFSKGQLSRIDGLHFFKSHVERAKKIYEDLAQNDFDVGNVVGYLDPEEDFQGTTRYGGVSILTDKNYMIVYSDSLTDTDGVPLDSGYKMYDMYVLSVCQVVNKYNRITRYANDSLRGKLPRSAILKAISDEKSGLALI